MAMDKQILIFHPDIHAHKTNNEYTKRIYGILESHFDVKSLEWFVKHPFAKNIEVMYLNWFENTIGRDSVLIQKVQYFGKMLLLRWAHFRKARICYAVHNKTPHSISKESSIYQMAAKPFMRKALCTSDVIVELCEHTEDYLLGEFNLEGISKKSVLVPHGGYTKYPCNASSYREKYKIGDKELVFTFVGKMDKYKNIDVILRAFYQANLDAKLLLVGKIDTEYENIIRPLIQDDRVITDFTFVSDEDMSGIMQMADAVVLPYENTSINSGIMINAFSNGTTVIGTNIEMLQDYGNDLVYGYSYSDGDEHIKVLAEAMTKAVLEGKEILAKKGHSLEEIIDTHNDWRVVEKALLTCVQAK